MEQYTIFFAGELFDHKHLVGNITLAQQIEQISQKKYQCLLPQDIEKFLTRGIEVRNHDLKNLLSSDVALFNFDGPDLDSGTAIEFMFAKSLDIPSVLLRTDIRGCFESEVESDPWNLMASGYPRTANIIVNSMKLYKELGIEGLQEFLAQKIIQSFDQVRREKSIFSQEKEIEYAYHHALKYCGSHLDQFISHQEIVRIVEEKIKKKLY